MFSKAVYLLSTFVVIYCLQECSAQNNGFTFRSCMANPSIAVNVYGNKYNEYVQRKYQGFERITKMIKSRLQQLNVPQTCKGFFGHQNASFYTVAVFQKCGGVLLNEDMYKPVFDGLSKGKTCGYILNRAAEFFRIVEVSKYIFEQCNFMQVFDVNYLVYIRECVQMVSYGEQGMGGQGMGGHGMGGQGMGRQGMGGQGMGGQGMGGHGY